MNFDDDQVFMGSLVGTSKCRAQEDYKNKDVKKICKAINKQWKSVKVKKDNPSQQKERAEARVSAEKACKTAMWEGATRPVCEWK